MSTDDLASLFTGGAADGRVVMGQATILSYDPSNNTHTLDFRGSQITNVGVLHGISAMGYESGQVVLLLGWVPQRGTSTWWILGRALIPGQDSPDLVVRGGSVIVEGGGRLEVTEGLLVASDSGGDVFRVDPTVPEIFMRQSLISELARQIISETVHFDAVPAAQSLNVAANNSTGFVDLTTTGPEVTFTTQTGLWVVMLFATLQTPSNQGTASMSYEASGAQNVSPDLDRAAIGRVPVSGTGFAAGSYSQAYANGHTGSSGEITVTAKYQLTAISTDPSDARWRGRSMVVIAF